MLSKFLGHPNPEVISFTNAELFHVTSAILPCSKRCAVRAGRLPRVHHGRRAFKGRQRPKSHQKKAFSLYHAAGTRPRVTPPQPQRPVPLTMTGCAWYPHYGGQLVRIK